MKAVVHGDVVTVTRIEHLARSTFDLFAIVKHIADADAQVDMLARRFHREVLGRQEIHGQCRGGPGLGQTMAMAS